MADTLVIKLENADIHVVTQRFLPATQVLIAFVYESTSLVGGATSPDFIPWDMVPDTSTSLEAVGIFALS